MKGVYDQTHCWQYDIRIKNLEQDLNAAGLSHDDTKYLRVSDFEFQFVPKESHTKCYEIVEFIKRHEWLGKMPTRPTHRFIASYKGNLAGVVIMATPNSFSNLLGPENRNLEKLISRGACISWSPKNLASALVMFSIKWMVKNSEFRFFTAYSDTEARELGTIYQACNFIYLGQNSGARAEYFDPSKPGKGWFSDRQFRKSSQVKRYAKELNIPWEKHWSIPDKILWNEIPIEVKEKIKALVKAHKKSCEHRELQSKHKYVYILGRSKVETKRLKSLFVKTHPKLVGLPYPKYRGPQIDTAAKNIHSKEQNLTLAPSNGRPAGHEDKPYLSVKEAAMVLGISEWTIYQLVKSDPSFPFLNIGLKKKFVIEKAKLEDWMRNRTNAKNSELGRDLLKMKGTNHDRA